MTREDTEHYARWALVNLGLSRVDFNRYTFGEFVQLLKLWEQREAVQNRRLGKLCYVVAVSAGATLPNDVPIPPDYFMPDYKVKERKRRKPANLLKDFINILAMSGVKTKGLN